MSEEKTVVQNEGTNLPESSSSKESDLFGYILIGFNALIIYLISARNSFLFNEARVPRGDPFSYLVGFFGHLDRVQQDFWQWTLTALTEHYNFYWLINSMISLLSPALFKEPYSIMLVNFVLFGVASASLFRLARFMGFGVASSYLLSLIIWTYPTLYGFSHHMALSNMQLDAAFNAMVITAVCHLMIYVLKPEDTSNALLAGFLIGLAVWGRGNSLPYLLLVAFWPFVVLVFKIYNEKDKSNKKVLNRNFFVFNMVAIGMSYWFYSINWDGLTQYYGDHIGIASNTPVDWNILLNNIKVIPGFLFWKYPESLQVLIARIFTLLCHGLILGSLLVAFKRNEWFEENNRPKYKILAVTAMVIFYSNYFFNLALFRTQVFSLPTPYVPMVSAVTLALFILVSLMVKKVERFLEFFRNGVLLFFTTLILIYGTGFSKFNTDLEPVKNAATPFEVEHFALNLDKELGGGTLAVLWYELYNAPVLQYYRMKNNMPHFRHYTGDAYSLFWSMNYSDEATKAVQEGIVRTFEEADFIIIPEFSDRYFQHEVYALFRQRDFIAEYLNSPNSPRFVVKRVLHDAGDVRLLMIQQKKNAPNQAQLLDLPYGVTRWSVDPYRGVNTDLIPRNVNENNLATPSAIKGLIVVPEDRKPYGPFYAFDRNLDSFWEKSGLFPHELNIQLEEEVVAEAYRLSSGPDNHGAHHRMPFAWTLQGSLNNVDWIDLDVQEDQKDWTHKETRIFKLKEPVKYKNYRALFSKGGSPDIIRLYSLELM